MQKLKKCPYCNNVHYEIIPSYDATNRKELILISCTNLTCGFTVQAETKEKAIKRWNEYEKHTD